MKEQYVNPNDGTAAAFRNRASEPAASLEEIFGKPIFVYTRAQAIADGVLVEFPRASFPNDGSFAAALIRDRVSVVATAGLIAEFGGRETMDAASFHHWKELFKAIRREAAAHMAECFQAGHQPRPDIHWNHLGVDIYCLNHPDEDGRSCLTFMLEGED